MIGGADAKPGDRRPIECVAALAALEARIEALLDQVRADVQGHARAAAAFERFHAVAKQHRDGIAAHLRELGGSAGRPDRAEQTGPPTSPEVGGASSPSDSGVCTGAVSRALRGAYLAFNEAALGYSVLHEIAHVSDSLRYAATLRLAERHLRGYAGAAQEINQLVAEVVSWELREEGQFCECQCPSCALGICWCIAHTTDAVNAAWRDTAPPHPSPGLRVVPNPRRPADLDVREGDLVIAVDGHRVATTADVMSAVVSRGHGEPIRFGIERRSAGTLEVTATRT